MESLKLLLILSIGFFECGESQTLRIEKLVTTFMRKFDSVIGTGDDMQTDFNLIVGGGSDESQAIIKDLNTIKNELNHMDESISSELQNMERILPELTRGTEIQEMKAELIVGIQMINEAWRTLCGYIDYSQSTSRAELEAYVNDYSPNITEFGDILSYDSLPVLLAKEMKENRKHICGTGAGTQQYLMNLFLMILNAEVKATILLTFMGKLRLSNEASKSMLYYQFPLTLIYRCLRVKRAHRAILEKRFLERHDVYVTEFSKGFDIASREYRSCDPVNGWVRGTSYFELEKFNQATMFRAPRDWFLWEKKGCDDRAADMTRDRDRTMCLSNLVDCYDTEEEICSGSLSSCTRVELAERCVLKNQSRRYQWIKANNGTNVLGRVEDGCESGEVIPSNNAWYCLCRCIEGQNKVSLEMSTSNLHRKRVVTAMRFAKKNNIIFIQIKEGKLGAKGTISKQINEWIPSSPTNDPKKLVTFDSIDNGFNIGDLVGKPNEVVAGVGFTKSEKSDKRLKLQILVIRFDYSTGVILGHRRNITSPEIASDIHNIGELNSIDASPDVDHVEDSLPGYYERFYQTPLTADAGQATVPLFDATPVEGNPVRPLSGVGLLHKGAPKYAGFLSLKAIGVDTGYFFKKYYLDKLAEDNELY